MTHLKISPKLEDKFLTLLSDIFLINEGLLDCTVYWSSNFYLLIVLEFEERLVGSFNHILK